MNQLLKFTPAKYLPGKDSRVEFYFQSGDRKKRIRYRVNGVSAAERKRYAMLLCEELNKKLYAGWNPLAQAEAGPNTSIEKSMLYYKGNFMPEREDSIRSYTSIIEIFLEWCNTHELRDKSITEINQKTVLHFLADVRAQRKLSPRTYNNYIAVLRTIFNKLMEHQFITENPFSKISKKRVNGKNRDVIPQHEIAKIRNWFQDHDPNMILIMKLIYYCGIRPTEICRLRVGNIRPNQGIIFIDADQAKDHDSAPITLPSHVMNDLISHIKDSPKFHYIISSGLRPGIYPTNGRALSKKWDRMRRALFLGDRYKLYSLKDSGALAIAMCIDSPVELQNQFRHSSLETTGRYIEKARPIANKNIVKMNDEW